MKAPLLYPGGRLGDSREGSYNVCFLLHSHTSDLGRISWYQRIAEVGCHPAQPISSIRGMSRLILNISKNGDSVTSLGSLCQRLVTLRGRASCVSVPVASGPVSELHRRAWMPPLCTCASGIYTHWWGSSDLLPAEQVQLFQPLLAGEIFWCLHHLHDLFLDSSQWLHFSCTGDRPDTPLQVLFSHRQQQLTQPAGTTQSPSVDNLHHQIGRGGHRAAQARYCSLFTGRIRRVLFPTLVQLMALSNARATNGFFSYVRRCSDSIWMVERRIHTCFQHGNYLHMPFPYYTYVGRRSYLVLNRKS